LVLKIILIAHSAMAKLCCQLLRGKVRTCVCNRYRCLGLASKIWSRRCLMTNANHKRRRQLKMLCKSVRAKSTGNALAQVLVLACPVLSCPFLSYPVPSCPMLSCRGLCSGWQWMQN